MLVLDKAQYYSCLLLFGMANSNCHSLFYKDADVKCLLLDAKTEKQAKFVGSEWLPTFAFYPTRKQKLVFCFQNNVQPVAGAG